jgi:rSAM/selenodomain-associated transferase 2
VPLLSVIIPTLDEAANLPSILADLFAQQGLALEVIVADGGSKDATPELAVRANVTLVSTLPGRGRQMNGGAVAANGEFFLFLHADSRLTDVFMLRNACAFLARAENQAGHQRLAGHFPIKFLRSLPGHALAFRYLEAKSLVNRPHTTNGDQGLLLRRDFFAELGGFDEGLPFLEDQKLAAGIRAKGAWLTLPGCLETSARRFEAEGFHRRYLLMGIILAMHSAGVAAFFQRAKIVYPAQKDTARLLPWPYFLLIWTMMRHDLGLRGSLRAWFCVGRFIRQNLWQMFFFMDVVIRPGRGLGNYPLLRFYDRWLGPCIGFAFIDALAGGLAVFCYMGVLAPWFWMVDQIGRKVR